MTWESVPWMIDGGEHSAEVGRLLAYAASGGGEGVIGPGDCKVTASAVADGNVHISPGGVAVLNRFAGGGQQTYLARNVSDEVKALTPQGSSGERYDLVAVIIEDPEYPGQPAPVDIATGPYLRTAVYEDVPADTRLLSEVDPDQSGYALARVHFNASDATVSIADITDLRQLVAPRTKIVKKVFSPPGINALPAPAYGVSPPGAQWNIDVPDWATRVVMEATWSGVQFIDTSSGAGNAGGYSKQVLGPIATQEVIWYVDAVGAAKPQTEVFIVADDIAVPEAIRGTTQVGSVQLRKTAGAALTSQTTSTTTVIATFTFTETVE